MIKMNPEMPAIFLAHARDTVRTPSLASAVHPNDEPLLSLLSVPPQ